MQEHYPEHQQYPPAQKRPNQSLPVSWRRRRRRDFFDSPEDIVPFLFPFLLSPYSQPYYPYPPYPYPYPYYPYPYYNYPYGYRYRPVQGTGEPDDFTEEDQR